MAIGVTTHWSTSPETSTSRADCVQRSHGVARCWPPLTQALKPRKRALAQAVIEAYYGLALANAQRRAAEGNLAAAEEFEHITSLLLSGGEVAVG